jgi:hypothetical protein
VRIIDNRRNVTGISVIDSNAQLNASSVYIYGTLTGNHGQLVVSSSLVLSGAKITMGGDFQLTLSPSTSFDIVSF